MDDGSAPQGERPGRHDIVELRVHGVSGARPERILGRAHVTQVAGDRSGGFHRPDGSDATEPDGLTLEAYRWGDLPSGTVARTLSLVFLLPFMLSNVAVWMRPTGRRSGAGVTVLCRLLALNLTVLYVVSISGVALDLLAWRCLGAAPCRAPFDTVAGLDGRQVGIRLAVLALLPIAAVAFLRLLGTRRPRPAGNPLWAVEPIVGRLRAIHVAAAFAVLDLTLLMARTAGGGTASTAVLLALNAAVLLVCAGLLAVPGLLDRAATKRMVTRAGSAVGAVAFGLSAATLLTVALDDRAWPSSDGLPGYDAIANWALLGQMSLLVALSGLVLWHHGRGERDKALPRGLGAAVVAAIAVGLAAALAADLVYQSGDLLGGYRGDGGPPVPYQWAILSFFLHASAGVMLCGALTLLSRRRRWRAAAAITDRDFPAVTPSAAGRLRQVTKTVARARFAEWLGLLAVTYAALAVIGLATGLLRLFDLTPAQLVRSLFGLRPGAVDRVLAMGSTLVAVVVVALLLGGVFAYRTAWFRRHVGILWDLGTFWPRAAHPFAPPSYADRAVPELADRITQLTERHRGVLLCGHSHGSVLLALAVLRLPPRVRQRVALLTYGSPLDRLYARLFPAYLNEKVLRTVGERVEWRWLNLWRDTDPVGGWIFAANRPGDPPPDPADPASRVDRRLRDPRDLLASPGERRPPPVRGHHPGESDPEFRAAVRELAGRLLDTDGG
ncbi:hypothetical protein [Micromonospora parathelypteridis]|uniref:Integral membrane protein n=1 Tax=Micromonospora parathelypteridis TaxID=1839617 RepID=A0A840W295_9ACTN|nr:hypothetical protein [Micromonospora parathelypteridis]MBB5480174.1 hypothetical protein [Micromonospora parathelypteridis]GGO24604.1 hypothetical protein GCM10011576_46340 [Micromonospora parathelypteridis]